MYLRVKGALCPQFNWFRKKGKYIPYVHIIYFGGVLEPASTGSQELIVHVSSQLQLVTSHWECEISHGENIYTMKISKCYRSGRSGEPVVKTYLP